ncbi:MAG: serine--tRNA ligase [Candidatus Bathyarchaeia archaeon]
MQLLDIRFVREHPEVVKDDLSKRGEFEKISLLDRLLELDSKWRSEVTRINELRKIRNRLIQEVEASKRSGASFSDKISEASALSSEIRKLRERVDSLREGVDSILIQLPNIMDPSVPFGKDDSDNVEVRRWGTPTFFDFEPKDHISLAEKLGLVDVERAAKVAGSRFYYLLDELVLLNYALIRYALDFLVRKGFTLVQPPYMIRREAVSGAVALSDFEDMIYKVENEDLYLIATSEHPILAMHMGEILDGNMLPLRYGGVSPCFRKEAGAHGRDTKGIFRTHQFEKVEQFVFCRQEDSPKEHEQLIANAEEFFQSLRIPYRVVNVCSGDLGTVAAKKYDLEAWLPGQKKFRELVSCSNCTSYQAVSAKIRYRDRPDEQTMFVHTLNSTLVATERALIAIMENYQNRDGSITIPDVLVPYMNGRTLISSK